MITVNNFIFLCDHAFIVENKISMVGIFDTIFLEKFPGGVVKFDLVGSLEIQEKNIKDILVSVKLIDEKGTEIVLNVPNTKLPVQKDSGIGKINLILSFGNLQFNNPGKYTFQIFGNDKKLNQVELRVVERKSND